MKQFILGLAIGAVFTFSCQHYFSQPEIIVSASTNAIVETRPTACDNKNALTSLARPTLPINSAPAPGKQVTEKENPASSCNSSELESLRAQVNMFEQRREFEQLTQPGKAETLAESSRKNFEQETVDNNWADNYQSQLSHFFRSDEQLNDVVPQSIECRSSRCRITIAVSNQQHFNQVANKLINSITSGGHNGVAAKALVSPEMEQGMLQLYVARDQQVNLIP